MAVLAIPYWTPQTPPLTRTPQFLNALPNFKVFSSSLQFPFLGAHILFAFIHVGIEHHKRKQKKIRRQKISTHQDPDAPMFALF
jgi:hypothetical protein